MKNRKCTAAKHILAIFALFAVLALVLGGCGGEDDSIVRGGTTVTTPELDVKDHKSITIIPSTLDNATAQTIEYGISTTNDMTGFIPPWQTGLTFSGLDSETDYYIFARSQANSDFNAGPLSDYLYVATDLDPDKLPNEAVAPPGLDSKTGDSITILAVTAPAAGGIVQYCINTVDSADGPWQTGLFFDNLKMGTEYFIFARSGKTATLNSGPPSAALETATYSFAELINMVSDIEGKHTFTLSDDVDGFEGVTLSTADVEIIIIGNGHSITGANGTLNLFTVETGATLTLNNVSLDYHVTTLFTNGDEATMTDAMVLIDSGTVEMIGATLGRPLNLVFYSSVYMTGTGGQLAMTDSLIQSGAMGIKMTVDSVDAVITMNGSTITGTGSRGIALYSSGANITITNSNIVEIPTGAIVIWTAAKDTDIFIKGNSSTLSSTGAHVIYYVEGSSDVSFIMEGGELISSDGHHAVRLVGLNNTFVKESGAIINRDFYPLMTYSGGFALMHTDGHYEFTTRTDDNILATAKYNGTEFVSTFPTHP